MTETNNNKESVTYGEQINYVFITLKELIIMQWEYIRKHRLWTVINTLGENSAENVENN
jgi:hypothetical protein|tara:strand:+ start:1998 stop:2174 length:177 start_codon:yes stop_codon:yes gene_type:complete